MTLSIFNKNPILELAKAAIDYAKEQVVYSANYANRDGYLRSNNRTLRLFELKLNGINGQIGELRNKTDDIFDETFNAYWKSTPQKIKDRYSQFVIQNYLETAIQSKLSEKYSLGNCNEMAAVAFMHLLKKKKAFPIEIFIVKDKQEPLRYNHGFIVMDRDPKSDPNNYKKWKAIICDPWARKAYPSSEMEQHLENYEGWDAARLYAPVLRKFDPKRHTLELFTANIFSGGN